MEKIEGRKAKVNGGQIQPLMKGEGVATCCEVDGLCQTEEGFDAPKGGGSSVCMER